MKLIISAAESVFGCSEQNRVNDFSRSHLFTLDSSDMSRTG